MYHGIFHCERDSRMKYMTFNSSCSYAGVANMLDSYGVSVEDRQIALDMKLPYLFSHENGAYCSGPMLQTAKWFNLYLKPRGFLMTETRLLREEVCSFLADVHTAMLGIAFSQRGKHAVVYTGMEGDRYRFLNNKHKNSSDPEIIYLTQEELLPLLNNFVSASVLQKDHPTPVDLRPYLQESADTLLHLKRDINAFCSSEQTPRALKTAQNVLFRAILLDSITMLELLENEEPLKTLKSVQGELLTALKENIPLTLADRLSMHRFEIAIDAYRELIQSHAEQTLL